MNEHTHVQRQLANYRELSAAERRSADRHAQECVVCAETLAAYAKMDRALADLPPLRPDPALRSNFQAALLARRKGDGLMSWRQIPTTAAQLAFLLAVLFLGWMFWQQLTAPEEILPAAVVDDREDETEATAVPTTAVPATDAPTPEPTAAIDEEPPTSISTAAWPQTQTVAGFPVTLRDVRHDETGITLWLDITAWGSLAGARLVDDQGRPYFQQNAASDIGDDLVSWEISFNRPPETARRLTLLVSLEVSATAEETVTIDLDGRQIGDQWEIQETVMVGGLPATFRQARLAPPHVTDAGALTEYPSLELTADTVAQDNARLINLFLRPPIVTAGVFGGGRYSMQEIVAYYELRDGLPSEPLTLAVEGRLALDEAYAFSWALPGQPEFEPLPVTAVVPQSLTPIFQANRIEVNPMYLSEGPYRWSADNQWVAFWSKEGGQPGTIHFLNTQTMQTCPFIQELYFSRHAVGWLPSGEAVVYEKSRLTGWRGAPCGNDWQAVEDISQIYLRPTPSTLSPISPGGDYLAEMRFAPDAQGVWLGTLTIQDRQTGTTLNTATWQHMGNTPNLYVNWRYLNEAMAEGRMPEGSWLDSETYLVDASLDQGPLLVTAGGDVIRPALDLFNVPNYVAGQGDWYLTVTAVKNPISQAYDFLLSSAGFAMDESPYPLLYHSGSGIVERLDGERPSQLHGFLFVGNGRWLIRYPPPFPEDNRLPLWIRPLTPPGNDLYTDLTNGTALVQSFAPYADYMADIEPNGRVVIRALPEGTPLAIWDAPDYRLSMEALWSRDGRYLLVAGEPRSGGQAALFLIPVE
jgi:hypothetical protein